MQLGQVLRPESGGGFGSDVLRAVASVLVSHELMLNRGYFDGTVRSGREWHWPVPHLANDAF
jgi:hypothetical protein